MTARPDLVFIAVPDGAVASAARELADGLIAAAASSSNPSRRPAAAHTSGVTPVAALDPLAELGCVTFCFHPLQTFADPLTGASRFEGATVAITPGPNGGFQFAAALARLLKAKPFLLEEDHRVLYHAAACVASNYLITLEYIAEKMFTAAGLPAEGAVEAFLPLVQGAIANLAAHGSVAALTGPLSRGDIGTVRQHLVALSQAMPEIAAIYRTLGLATLDIVRARGTVSEEVIDQMHNLLSVPPTAHGSNT